MPVGRMADGPPPVRDRDASRRRVRFSSRESPRFRENSPSIMNIQVHGAAGGHVTGSAYLVRTDHATVLVDAGYFQGGREAESLNVLPPELDPRALDAVILTHAHLDHTGRVPLLVKAGYEGPIFMTGATLALADIILKDSAKLQAYDTERANRKRQRAGEPLLEPPFGPAHVDRIADLARQARLGTEVEVARGITAQFFEAGHILGSSSVRLTVSGAGATRTVVFSGDLGPTTLPILREFDPPDRADLVFLESTYGDRDHRSYPETVAEFERIVSEVAGSGGKLLIPTFAIGRAQQILYHLALLFRKDGVRPFPVYLDSPMAIEATRVYVNFPQLFDEEMQALTREGVESLGAGRVRATVTADESRALNELSGPCAILAGAGMCTGGRIIHHLKQNLWKPDTHVLIVGYQAHGTLGRQLVDGAEAVTIHGERVVVRGKVHTLGGFSAHAGQTELLQWLGALMDSRPRVALTHGENEPRQALARTIEERWGAVPRLPALGETIEL